MVALSIVDQDYFTLCILVNITVVHIRISCIKSSIIHPGHGLWLRIYVVFTEA